MPANHTEVVVNETTQSPEQDRFSVVVQAHYSQWDASPTALVLRYGRLVKAEKSPLVIPKIVLPEGELVDLDLGMVKNTRGTIVVVINPQTPLPEKLPPYAAFYRNGETYPTDLIPAGSFVWASPPPGTALHLRAMYATLKASVHFFPE